MSTLHKGGGNRYRMKDISRKERDKLYSQISDKGYVRPELVAKALKGLTKPYNKYKEKFGNVYNLATAKK